MLKLIALICMLVAHIGYVYFPTNITMEIIGRIAFPLFAYGIVEGYKYTSNFKFYALRVFTLGILSQYPYSLLFHNQNLNVCFTLFLGLLVLRIYESNTPKIIKTLLILSAFLISDICNFEYGMYGLGLIFVLHVYDCKKAGFMMQTVITILGIYFYDYSYTQVFALISFWLILLFRQYKIQGYKFSSYAFYPVHIVILFSMIKLF